MEKHRKLRRKPRSLAVFMTTSQTPHSLSCFTYGTKVDGIKPRNWHVFPIDNYLTRRRMASVQHTLMFSLPGMGAELK